MHALDLQPGRSPASSTQLVYFYTGPKRGAAPYRAPYRRAVVNLDLCGMSRGSWFISSNFSLIWHIHAQCLHLLLWQLHLQEMGPRVHALHICMQSLRP